MAGCLHPLLLSQFDENNNFLGNLKVRCNHCVNCKSFLSRQWAFRCILESKQHKFTWFLTLTYDDNHLRFRDLIDGETVFHVATNFKRDYQLLFKNVRSAGVIFRYFIVGEYGEKSERPHYHAVIFGPNHQEILYFKKFWDKGFVDISLANDKSIFYTTGYVQKKLYSSDRKDESVIRLPTFSQASINPPLGFETFLKLWNKGKVKTENGFYSINYNGFSYPVPRIFLNKLGKKNEILSLILKQKYDNINNMKRLNDLGVNQLDVDKFNFKFKERKRNAKI